MAKRLKITVRIVPDGKSFNVFGKQAWALLELHRCGPRGCTPIDRPGPRWSGYVHKLRTRYGLSIETVNEKHGGQFAGTHARYILHTQVEIFDGEASSEMAVAA